MSNIGLKVFIVAAVAMCAGSAMGASENPPAFSDARWQSVAGNGEAFDLTALYLPFHEGQTVEIYLFLADWKTNAPVTEAEIELTMTGDNFREELRVKPLDEAGLYHTSVAVPEHTRYSFLAEVSAGDAYDLLSLSGFQAGGHSPAHEETEGSHGGTNWNLFALLAVAVVCGLGGVFLGMRATRSGEAK